MGIKKLLKLSAIAMVLPSVAFGAQAPNPRGNSGNTSGRNTSYVQEVDSNASIRRSATSVIARSTSSAKKNRTVVNSRSAVNQRSSSALPRTARVGNKVISGSVSNLSRAAASNIVKKASVAAYLNPKTSASASKAGGRPSRARATAVFGDVSKIGGGYASCRDSYATCMDQFCAAANETYRRCFCSDRFTEFRDTADALDSALQMLAEFQDNNLNAVDKTAAEVNAMYTASAGESAIKRDTSASQKLLDSIGDILSGKKKSSSTKSNNSSNSVGVLDFSNLSSSLDNVWGGGDAFGGGNDSLFGGGNSGYTDMSELEGKELYTNANKQCAEITREACKSDAMFNLARSSYSIFITQDCNLYEKNINAKKSSVEETVRQAEKYLREARLEEYRAHNSADVNTCLNKVEEAIKQPTACGPKYERCLDYTGLYIDTATGEPIYTKALFGLNNLIKLSESSDVLGQNKEFNNFLDEKKMFVTGALDSCRDIADTVWYEFKRSALIRIAQAQDEKIQSIKDNCVVTMKKCYDKQTGDLNALDDTNSQSTGAISAVAARGICYDDVMACAALYGDPDGCQYDDAAKKLTAKSGKTCGLQALLAFVDTVDSIKVAEGCETAINKYVDETLCPPVEIVVDTETGEETKKFEYGSCAKENKKELRAKLESRIKLFCAQDLVNNDSTKDEIATSAYNLEILNRTLKDIFDKLEIGFSAGCEDMGGVWINDGDMGTMNASDLHPEFYNKYYRVSVANAQQVANIQENDVGYCVKGNLKTQCLAQNTELNSEGENVVYAEFNEAVNECILTADWYSKKCSMLGGTYYNQQCEIQNVISPEQSSIDDLR